MICYLSISCYQNFDMIEYYLSNCFILFDSFGYLFFLKFVISNQFIANRLNDHIQIFIHHDLYLFLVFTNIILNFIRLNFYSFPHRFIYPLRYCLVIPYFSLFKKNLKVNFNLFSLVVVSF